MPQTVLMGDSSNDVGKCLLGVPLISPYEEGEISPKPKFWGRE